MIDNNEKKSGLAKLMDTIDAVSELDKVMEKRVKRCEEFIKRNHEKLGITYDDVKYNFEKINDTLNELKSECMLNRVVELIKRLTVLNWVGLAIRSGYVEVMSYEQYARVYVFMAYSDNVLGDSELIRNGLLALRYYVGVPSRDETFETEDAFDAYLDNLIEEKDDSED